MSAVLLETPRRMIGISIDGNEMRVPEGSTILEACRRQRIDTPTLCYLETLSPVNVCRVCVVEVEGSRTLVPACSRKGTPPVPSTAQSKPAAVATTPATPVHSGSAGSDHGSWG